MITGRRLFNMLEAGGLADLPLVLSRDAEGNAFHALDDVSTEQDLEVAYIDNAVLECVILWPT